MHKVIMFISFVSAPILVEMLSLNIENLIFLISIISLVAFFLYRISLSLYKVICLVIKKTIGR